MHNQIMLAAQDIKQIKKIVEDVLDQKLDQKLEEKLKFLPTKEDFYTKMDEIMGELKAIREEQMMLSYRVSQHSDEISTLQNIHPNSQHPVAI